MTEVILKELKASHVLYKIIVLYIAASWLIAAAVGVWDRFSLLLYSEVALASTFLSAVCFLFIVVLRIMIVDRPKHLTRRILHDLQYKWITPQRVAGGLPVICCLMLFMATFSSVKSTIPIIVPFGHWDQIFYKWDHVLHFGTDPWRLLDPLLGYPFASFVINLFYNLWFPIMFGIIFWQAFSMSRPDVRSQFFSSFFCCWIVNGSLLATAFSSVGPGFYGLLYGEINDPFADQLAYLRAASEQFPIWALETQDVLWRSYEQNELSLGSGISAMPSLHVSIALLQVFLGYQICAKLGHVFLVFFLLIMAGSVHLAWHYAIDGYVSVVTTSLIWWFCGKTSRSAQSIRSVSPLTR